MNLLSFDMDFQAYQKNPRLNHSLLRELFPPKTPADFIWRMNHPIEKTDSLNFGSALHIAVFEHEKFDDAIAVAPNCDRRSKAGKEEYQSWLSTIGTKIILDQDQLDMCYRVIEKIQKHPIIKRLLSASNTKFESSGFFTYREIECKFRTDFLLMNQNLIVDLKTTKSGHERSWQKSILDYSYHSQAAFYLLGMEIITGEKWDKFLWITVESHGANNIYLYEPDAAWLIYGRQQIEDAISLYISCMEKKEFPGPSSEIQTITVPSWLDNIIF